MHSSITRPDTFVWGTILGWRAQAVILRGTALKCPRGAGPNFASICDRLVICNLPRDVKKNAFFPCFFTLFFSNSTNQLASNRTTHMTEYRIAEL